MTLQRYNQIAIAILTTAVLIGALVLGVCAIFSILKPQHAQEGVKVAAQANTQKPRQNLVLCMPATVPGSDYEYVPVGAVVERNAAKAPMIRSDLKAAEGYSSTFGDCQFGAYNAGGRIYNAVVRNTRTGEERLLLNAPGQIAGLQVPDDKCKDGEGAMPCGMLLWSIRSADTNHDGLINGDDAVVAYSSDLAVSRLQQLTPDGATVLAQTWNLRDKRLVFQIRWDTNEDGRYTEEDGSELVETDATKPAMTKAALSREVTDKLKAGLH